MQGPISNSVNVINTKDLLARIHWLEEALNYRCTDEYSEELKRLRTLAEHVESPRADAPDVAREYTPPWPLGAGIARARSRSR